MIKNKNTLILILTLVVAIIILLLLSVAVVDSVIIPALNPNFGWMEMPIDEGMPLAEAKEMLTSLGIAYEIKPTDSRVANRVEKFDATTKEENGVLLVKVGTAITLYGNEKDKTQVIYLTFDDGPTRDNTHDILDKLQVYGIKASFFVEGRDVERYPERMEATFLRGHVFACHSHTHELANVYSSVEAFVDEIKQYETAMIDAIGKENFDSVQKIMRFPGGTNNAYLTNAEALEYIQAARELGYKIYDWTALTGDAEGNSDAASFISYLDKGLEKAKSTGLDLIVLMHDKWSTNEALNDIIDHLIAKGYYFDTIDNCPEYTFAEN